ncbi:TadE/TadG family type IV pilus assembly protein [Janibacter sp. LM]|uniref:TadE/TadG family type IV pilus assembly protein n=1 Tax=Janibacter sp. LM TaxID=3144845 RepID=UPI0031F62584
MARTRRSRPAWRQRGAAAVELAIVLPLLFLVMAGIIDFGRYFLTEIQLTNAVREGARVAVIGEDIDDIRTRVLTAAPAVPGLTAGTVTVAACAGAGSNATVTATGDFDWILLEPALNMFGAAGALPEATAEAVMRCGG